MSYATLHTQIQIENYNSSIGTGANGRVNKKGLTWKAESEISMYTQLQNTSLTVGIQNGSVTNFGHTDRTSITIEARFYFVKNIGQPYAQAFISGSPGHLPDEHEISIGLYIFHRNNQYERYIDMLRNEGPVYLQFSCEIDEDQSNYRTFGPNLDLLPIEQIQIRGLSKVSLNTNGEEVGEGE